MDGIKMYGTTKTQMKGILKIIEEITTDINMEFGINKCKMLTIEKSKQKDEITTEILNRQTLNNMKEDETNKYLGF